MARTLILGGGFGGLGAADELRKLLPTGHEIVLVDQSAEFYVGATKAWVMTGYKLPKDVVHKRTSLSRKGVNFVHADIRSIDPAARSVTTDQGTFSGDHLIVALGAALDLSAVPGLEAAHHFYSLEGALRLREALRTFAGGRVVLVIPRIPFKCPAGPYEGMLMLADWFRVHAAPKPVQLAIATAEGAPMATGGPEIGAAVRAQLEKAGIEYRTQQKISRIDGAARQIHFESGDPMSYDMLLAVPPHTAPAVVKASKLAGPNGWIPVDAKTCAVAGFPGVFAVGDVTSVSLPGRFKPDVPLSLPKAGVIAEGQGRTVARNIAASLGHGTPAEFDGKGYCYVETGDLHALRAEGSFFAMPHPTMVTRVPDMTQFEEKKTWVAETVARLLGGGAV